MFDEMGIVDGKLRRQKIDQSPYLFHFTKGTIEEAGNAMYSIIESERLISNRGYISFTSSPITALKKFFETKINRTGLPMYQPIGIGFSRDLLVKEYGARNVIYSNRDEYKEIPEQLKWRSDTYSGRYPVSFHWQRPIYAVIPVSYSMK